MPTKSKKSAPSKKKTTTKTKKHAKKPTASLKPNVSNKAIQGMMGMATETVCVVSAPHKRAKRVGLTAEAAPCVWLQGASGSINGPIGQQNITLLGQWNSIADTQQMSTLTFANAAAAVTGQNPTRFCVQSLQAEVQLVNSSTASTQVDIYDIVCRRDVPILASAVYNASTPQAAWMSGVELQSTLSDPGGSPQAYIIGSLPTDSQLFKDYYKVIQRKTVLMGPTAQHTHKFSIRTNKEFDRNMLSTMNGTMSGLKGYTHFTMLVTRGQPGLLGAAGGVTTLTNPLLRYVTTERYVYSAVYRNGSQFTYGNTVPAGAGVINLLTINNPAVIPIIGA